MIDDEKSQSLKTVNFKNTKIEMEEIKMSGKEIRLERIITRDTGKAVIVPMDHGVSLGPIEGIVNIREAMRQVAEGGANAVVVHKGVVAQGHRKSGPDMGLIVHLSASTSLALDPNAKTLVCSRWGPTGYRCM